MRTIFFFLLLLCSNPLFSQNKSSIKNMSDQQKFMEAYETLANLAKKNPLMPKLWTDAQMNLLRQAKEIYFALKNEAAGDNNNFKAQTVAYKSPNPDPIPDDDDPNTIKKKEFAPAVLGLLTDLRKNLANIERGGRPVLIAVVKEKLTAKMKNKTPIGKILRAQFFDALDKIDKINTIEVAAQALIDVASAYNEDNLKKHYKDNIAAYLKNGGTEEGEVYVSDFVGDIPTDTTFITAAAEAYEEEEKAKINNENVETNKDAFVQHTSDFLNALVLGLKTCEQENYTIDIPKILTTWRIGLEIKVKGDFQPFLPLLKSIESLGKTTTANAFYAAVKSTIEKEFSPEKLKSMAPQCADCDFGKMLPLERAKQYAQVVLNEKNVLQDAFVKIWIDRQTEWINSIPGDANEFTGFSIKTLKELESDFQNAKFWFKDFKSALDKITKDSISTSELKLLLNSARKDAAALEKEFSNCLEEQKNNTKNFVDSLSILLPAGNVFLLSANYKPTIIKINPTPAEIAEGVKSASDSLKFEFSFPVGEDISKPFFKVGIAVPIKLSERKYKLGNNKMYPHFYVAGDAQGYISANSGVVGAEVISVDTTIGNEPKDLLTPYLASMTVAITIKLPAIEVTQEDSSSSPSFGVTLLSAAAGGGAAAIALLSNPAGWVIGAAGLLTCVAGLFAGYSTSKATGKTWVFPEETYTITMEGTLQSVLNTDNFQFVQISLQALQFRVTDVTAMNNADDIKKKLQTFSGSATSKKPIRFEEPL